MKAILCYWLVVVDDRFWEVFFGSFRDKQSVGENARPNY